jgi:hypothetical protein
MTENPSDLITVEVTTSEAKLIVAALRQFEPFWPSDLDDLNRAEVLAGIRHGVDRVVSALDRAREPTS